VTAHSRISEVLTKLKNNLRSIIRIFFLILIFTLWSINKIEVWLFILLAGLLITPFMGRVYCGWICPIFTSIDIFSPIIKEKKLQKYNKYFQKMVFKVVIFMMFLVVFFLTKKLDLAVPFFILLIPIGLLIAVLFGSSQWHHICPFGIIFSLPARFATKGYNLISRDCSKCGLCVNKCANSCLILGKNRPLYFGREHCLSCGKCKDSCPQNNISFGKLPLKQSRGGTAL